MRDQLTGGAEACLRSGAVLRLRRRGVPAKRSAARAVRSAGRGLAGWLLL